MYVEGVEGRLVIRLFVERVSYLEVACEKVKSTKLKLEDLREENLRHFNNPVREIYAPRCPNM